MTFDADRQPLPQFNPLDGQFRSNPYPVYRRYRLEDPVHWAGAPNHRGAGTWYLFRHADVMAALKNPNLVRHPRILPPDPLQTVLANWMLFRNPPDHTRLRSLVSKAFTRQMAERLQPAIQETADFLLDCVAADGGMELMAHYASPLPLIVIAELLGIPSSDRERLRRWTMDLALGIDVGPSEAVLMRATRSTLELIEYLREIVTLRRGGAPKDDLISALILAEEEGDELTEDELLSMCVTAARRRPRDDSQPDWQRQPRAAVPSRPVGAAADRRRMYRTARSRSCSGTDSPVQITFREARADGELGGKRLRKGEIVAILLGAANRDPEAFQDPDTLDVVRAGSKHGAFGLGIHFCLGSHLARLEAHIAFRTLAERMPGLALSGQPNRTSRGHHLPRPEVPPGPLLAWLSASPRALVGRLRVGGEAALDVRHVHLGERAPVGMRPDHQRRVGVHALAQRSDESLRHATADAGRSRGNRHGTPRRLETPSAYR